MLETMFRSWVGPIIAKSFSIFLPAICLLSLLCGLACFEQEPDESKGFLPGRVPKVHYAHAYPQDFNLTEDELPRVERVLRIGVVPAIGSKAAADRYKPVASYLSDTLNVEIEVAVGTSYGDLVDRFSRNEMDLVIVPALSYLEALQRVPGIQPIVSKIALGTPSYSSFLVVRKADSARSLEDLKGRKIAFVHENSTSGFLFPYAALLDEGIDPSTDLEELIFAGSHPRSLALVATGRVAAAATSSGIEESSNLGKKWVEEGEEWAPLRILKKVGRIPYDVVCAHPTLPQSTVEKIRKIFLELNTRSAEGLYIWQSTRNITGWLPFDDSRYDGVRKVREKVLEHRKNHRGNETIMEADHGY